MPVLDQEELSRTWRTADALAKSGYFKDAKQATQAFAKILAGRDLGLGAFEAMSALHVIEGKIEASADLQASRVKASDKYDYQVAVITNEQCSIFFFQDGEKIGTSSFTMEDAQTAGLVRKGSPWEKFPRNMLFARAMSNGVAFFCPDVMGGLRIYSEGELPRPQDVTAGEGTAERVPMEEIVQRVAAWAPSPKVATDIVLVLQRARELGHAGLADYGTVQLRLKGQTEAFIGGWVEGSHKVLDALEEEPVVEATASEQEPSALELEEKALRLADEADSVEENGNVNMAAELRAEAESIREQAMALGNPEQMEIG